MHNVNLSITATRTDIDEQFKGTITFRNEAGDEVVYEYIATNPKAKEVNIKFSGRDDNFHIQGIPSKELIEKLTDKQKWIFGLSINLLSNVLDTRGDLLLSHETTQMMRMFQADASGKMSSSFGVEEDGYQFVFSKEISENRKLEEIHKETGIPLPLLKRAKYSTLSQWKPGCTLEEAEEAYENAPEEGKEPGDKTLLQTIKSILHLKLNVEA